MRLEWLIAGNDCLAYDIKRESWSEQSAKENFAEIMKVLETLLAQ